jgi:hypothetical protein
MIEGELRGTDPSRIPPVQLNVAQQIVPDEITRMPDGGRFARAKEHVWRPDRSRENPPITCTSRA